MTFFLTFSQTKRACLSPMRKVFVIPMSLIVDQR